MTDVTNTPNLDAYLYDMSTAAIDQLAALKAAAAKVPELEARVQELQEQIAAHLHNPLT